MQIHRAFRRRRDWERIIIALLLAAPLFSSAGTHQTVSASEAKVIPAGPDLTGAVERVGNPFTMQYPGGDLIYARNIWDMQVFDGRLYFGYGNSNNLPPAPNAGPVDIWSYNAATDSFTAEARISEEQIDDFLVLGDQLLIPGHDMRETPGNLSSVYRLENGVWTQYRTIEQAAHVFTLAVFQDRLFAGVSSIAPASPVRMLSSTDVSDKAWVFVPIEGSPLPPDIAWQFLSLGDELYLIAAKLRFVNTEGKVVTFGNEFFHLQGNEFKAIALDPFLNQPQVGDDELKLRAVRAVEFDQHTVYIGAYSQIDGHQWTPFGLFSLRKDEGNAQQPALPIVEKHPLTRTTADGSEVDMLPWDTLLDGDTLYVLASTASSGTTTNSVFATCDLVNWREVLAFNAETFARSFEQYNGDFYFGMGTGVSPLAEAAGDVLRIPHSNYTSGCS